MNPVSSRLLSQQLICPQFNDPAEVVAWFGAIQAQDYRGMRWAAAMRTKKPSHKAFEKAFNDGRIIRTHLQRTTWQLVSGEDYHWMLELCRAKALTGLRGWMHSNGIDIQDDEKCRIQELLADIVAGKSAVLKEDIALALEERGVSMTDQRLSYHLRLAEYDGLLCSGDLHPTKRTLALVLEKIGRKPVLEHDESLALLARKYFRSHGPATLEDYAWWSGLNIGDCRRGMCILGDELSSVRLGGKDYYFHRDARTRGFRGGNVLLIPAFDEYLIGYKSRHVVLHPDHAPKAHNQSGIFYNVVTLDGEIVGNWRPQDADCGVSVFKEGVQITEEALRKELHRFHSYYLLMDLNR
ncbi:MAG: AlkZ family DNA glycosylase [Bacteroidales bacterium]|nr:AlkZ family DNA glycosylase [Bacteroidales bacterium]